MSRKSSLWKGALAGAAGGALGTLVLNLVQKASLEGTREVENHWADGHKYTKQQQQLLDTFEQAHVATAEAVVGHVPYRRRERTAMQVEFAFGIVCSALYGAAAEYVPAVTTGFGSMYGAVLFTGASEVVLPAIHFVPSPVNRTPIQHLGGLAGNVVYGLTTEAVRLLFRERV